MNGSRDGITGSRLNTSKRRKATILRDFLINLTNDADYIHCNNFAENFQYPDLLAAVQSFIFWMYKVFLIDFNKYLSYYNFVFISISKHRKIMEASIEVLADQLKGKGIRPSYQRVKVLDYLNRNGGHPTVEDIFRALSPGIPSLSKVTVYNTLRAFIEAGLVRAVEIDEGQMRFDITLEDHGHFMCEGCGTIYNFPVNIDPIPIEGLKQFVITQKNVHFKGLCPNCLENPNTIIKEKNE